MTLSMTLNTTLEVNIMDLKKIANRLKERVGSSNEVVVDEGLTDLVDAHLTMVSAAHGSCHGSGHNSGGHSSAHQSGNNCPQQEI